MQYRQLPGINKQVSQLVQGTMMINSRDQAQSFALLDAVIELGCTTLDTAHVYGNGDSERVVGQWMQARGNREQVVIIGKGAHHNQDRKRVTPFDITAHLYDSLARLQTDYIDLYLLHRDDPEVPVGLIVETLHEHRAAGRIHAYGGSNWTVERLQEANIYAETHGLTPFVASSPNFSLADQKQAPWPDCVTISGPGNAEARHWYQETQLPLFTWSSLAGGFFSGRFRRDNLADFEEYMDRVVLDSYCAEDNFQRLDRAEELAEELGLSLPQVALAYVLHQPLNIHALVGCRSRGEFQANAAAAALELPAETLEWLDLRRDSR